MAIGSSSDYEQRIADQVAQYAETVDIHALPEIFHEWSHNYIREPVQHVFGSSDATLFYIDAYKAALPKDNGRILSIGCGDGTIETAMAKRLKSDGIAFELIGADLSPILLKTMRRQIAEAGLQDHVKALETDLNNLSIDGPFDLVMAHHSLHHIVNLEGLFDFAKDTLTETGIFATQDMIGRNGHQRWPEARAVLEALWPLLSEKQRYHAQLKRLHLRFRDHDCARKGFEGIRAQDILALMLQRFFPARFFACGGFIDLLTDRGYGHGFDRNNQDDVALIRALADLNEMLLDAGIIKPTLMFAWFSMQQLPEIHYRNRTAQFCLRPSDPDWVRWWKKNDWT